MSGHEDEVTRPRPPAAGRDHEEDAEVEPSTSDAGIADGVEYALDPAAVTVARLGAGIWVAAVTVARLGAGIWVAAVAMAAGYAALMVAIFASPPLVRVLIPLTLFGVTSLVAAWAMWWPTLRQRHTSSNRYARFHDPTGGAVARRDLDPEDAGPAHRRRAGADPATLRVGPADHPHGRDPGRLGVAPWPAARQGPRHPGLSDR